MSAGKRKGDDANAPPKKCPDAFFAGVSLGLVEGCVHQKKTQIWMKRIPDFGGEARLFSKATSSSPMKSAPLPLSLSSRLGKIRPSKKRKRVMSGSVSKDPADQAEQQTQATETNHFTHLVVGPGMSLKQALKKMGVKTVTDLPGGALLTSSDWLVDCLKSKQLLGVDPYLLKPELEPEEKVGVRARPKAETEATAGVGEGTDAEADSEAEAGAPSPPATAPVSPSGRGLADGKGRDVGQGGEGKAGERAEKKREGLMQTAGPRAIAPAAAAAAANARGATEETKQGVVLSHPHNSQGERKAPVLTWKEEEGPAAPMAKYEAAAPDDSAPPLSGIDSDSDSGSDNDDEEDDEDFELPPYPCQRKCPRIHPNLHVTALLDELIDFYLSMTGQEAKLREVSFCLAASALRALPRAAKSGRQLRNIKGINSTSMQMISEIIRTKKCSRLEVFRKSPALVAQKALCSVHGVGPAVAEKWVKAGVCSVDQAQQRLREGTLEGVTEAIRKGLQYYTEFHASVSRKDAEAIAAVVRQHLDAEIKARKLMDVEVHFELVGGYRRGKEMMHDVDILTSVKGRDRNGLCAQVHEGLLDGLAARLIAVGFLTHHFKNVGHFGEQNRADSILDSSPHAILQGICKLEGVSRRIDLVMVPPLQWGAALLGWTGNRQFERSIRRYATAERGIVLSQKGMTHGKRKPDGYAKGPTVEGSLEEGTYDTEEKIFAFLGLEFIPPHLRFC